VVVERGLGGGSLIRRVIVSKRQKTCTSNQNRVRVSTCCTLVHVGTLCQVS
jgi:hypothetical protein